MASIQRRKDRGTIRVRWRNLSGGEETRTCPDLATAKLLKLEVERSLALGRDWTETPDVQNSGPPISDVAEAWLRQFALRLSPRTLRVRAYQMETFLRYMRTTTKQEPTVEALGRSRLHGFHAWLLDGTGRHGKTRDPSTVRRLVGVVEMFWVWAFDWQDEEPTWKGFVPKPREITSMIARPAEQHRPAPTWTDMAKCIHQTEGWQNALLTVLYYTGLRVQQALDLKRNDIDLAAMILRIRPKLGKTNAEKAGRYIPISPFFAEWVFGLPRVEGGWLVPCGRKVRKPRDRDIVRAWLRTNVPFDRWEGRPHHCFRAGWVSGVRRAGGERDAVEFLVGHAPSIQTDRAYMDPDALHLRAAVALIPRLAPPDV